MRMLPMFLAAATLFCVAVKLVAAFAAWGIRDRTCNPHNL